MSERMADTHRSKSALVSDWYSWKFTSGRRVRYAMIRLVIRVEAASSFRWMVWLDRYWPALSSPGIRSRALMIGISQPVYGLGQCGLGNLKVLGSLCHVLVFCGCKKIA